MNYEHLDPTNHYGAWEHTGNAIVFQPVTVMAYNPALLPALADTTMAMLLTLNMPFEKRHTIAWDQVWREDIPDYVWLPY